MFTILALSTILSIVSSFFCSLTEAALFSVPLAHLKHQAQSGQKIGKILLDFKENMGRPISAILILNTVAMTGASAMVGAQASKIWGDSGVAIVSVAFTLILLAFGEIFPKIIGVVYSKQVAALMALPLYALVWVLWPLLHFVEKVTEYFGEKNQEPRVSQEEVLQMASMGREEGTIDAFEGKVISNVIALDKTTVEKILTPRMSVFKVDEGLTLSEVRGQISEWSHSRIPVHSSDDPDHLTGYVRQRDVYRALQMGQDNIRLKQISRSITTVPELKTVDKLLNEMFEKNEHICAVTDEHGALAGIVTLEDILEEIVGREIIDEYDPMRDIPLRNIRSS